MEPEAPPPAKVVNRERTISLARQPTKATLSLARSGASTALVEETPSLVRGTPVAGKEWSFHSNGRGDAVTSQRDATSHKELSLVITHHVGKGGGSRF